MTEKPHIHRLFGLVFSYPPYKEILRSSLFLHSVEN